MKRIWLLLCAVLLITGCGGKGKELHRAMELRSRLLEASECSFRTEITADYGDKVHNFTMENTSDGNGNVRFTVSAPDSIAGIAGTIRNSGGELTFEDTALSFPLLADGQLAPVSAPWLLMKTLRSGYLTSAGMEGELLRITIDDRYEEDALTADIWIDSENCPVRGEFLWQGRSILTILVEDFRIG